MVQLEERTTEHRYDGSSRPTRFRQEAFFPAMQTDMPGIECITVSSVSTAPNCFQPLREVINGWTVLTVTRMMRT